MDAIYDAVIAIGPGATPAQIWAYATRTLTDPDSYKADVSALALEATLTTHDGDIKTLLAALNDLSDTEVWAYVTRTLTSHAFPFTNPGAALDVSNIRTAAYGQYNTEMARITADVATEAKQDTIDGLIDGIIADIGVFPTTNYATFAAYVEDIRTRLNAIAAYIDTEIGAIETKLDTPANFMADVSALALESTLSTMKQKATGPAYNQDTDSLEALREKLDSFGVVWASRDSHFTNLDGCG